jgi:DNA-binding response OmpR family regulator
MIEEAVWGFDFDCATNVVDVYIGLLRRKLEAGDKPRLIHTVRGAGYVLRPEAGDARER